MNTDAILALSGTIGSVILSLIAFFLNKIIEDNKEAHKEFAGDIKELRYDLGKMNEELAKIGLVSKQAITEEDKNEQEKRMRNSIARVNKKVETLQTDVSQVKSIVQPEAMEGLVLYEPIPVYLARLSKKQEEQEDFNNQSLRILRKHNEQLVKLKTNQIVLHKEVEELKRRPTDKDNGGAP